MQYMKFNKTRNAASALWQSLVRTSEPDHGYKQQTREPVQRSEITAMFALNYRSDNAQGFSKQEQREHDNLSTLRDILYPANHA